MSESFDSSRRTAEQRVQILVGLILAVVLLALGNYLAYRHYRRFDWTEGRSFTLSDRSRQVLRRLDRDVTVYVLVSREDQIYQDLDELLRSYGALTTRLRVHRVDPNTQQGEYRLLQSRFGISAMETEGGEQVSDVDLVVEAGERHWNVRRDDLVQADVSSLGSDQGPVLDVQTERAITGAIVQVLSGRSARACVASGHGEYVSAGAGDRSLAALEEDLRLDNVELETFEIRGHDAIPATCDAVLVVGPQRAFRPEEAAALGAYVDGGGHLLIAVDPTLDARGNVEATGLETMLRAKGIVLGRDLVLETDRSHLLGGDPTELFLVDGFVPHPLSAPLAAVGAGIAMHSARSVTAVEGGPAQAVARTTQDAYAETDVAALALGQMLAPSEGDLRGPVGLVAAYPAVRAEDPAAGEAPKGLLVVVGDADWLRGELLAQSTVANRDFAEAIVGFLTERPALVSIAPRRARAHALLMPSDGPRSIFIRVVVLLPLAFALLGFSVWWSRRS